MMDIKAILVIVFFALWVLFAILYLIYRKVKGRPSLTNGCHLPNAKEIVKEYHKAKRFHND